MDLRDEGLQLLGAACERVRRNEQRRTDRDTAGGARDLAHAAAHALAEAARFTLSGILLRDCLHRYFSVE
ncbi:hypothetical protein [Paraburkholderia youngii]|uniref:hypothetical protein n=1 Tax=Paraburkholderia youngii TaxID=2782701 RepID=UPI003D1E7A58